MCPLFQPANDGSLATHPISAPAQFPPASEDVCPDEKKSEMDIDTDEWDSDDGHSTISGANATEDMDIDETDAIDENRAHLSLDMIRVRRQERVAVRGNRLFVCIVCLETRLRLILTFRQ
jgi:hypothetical protein